MLSSVPSVSKAEDELNIMSWTTIGRASLLAGAATLILLIAPSPTPAQDLATVSAIRTLTTDGGRVAWSKKDLIAFDRRGADDFFDIWLVNPDGSNERCITCNHPSLPNLHIGNPSFHPTEDWIVFMAQQEGTDSRNANPGAGTNNDVWAMRLDGSGVTRLTDIQPGEEGVLHPHFSRQGNQLLWVRRVGDTGFFGTWDLRVADISLEGDRASIRNERFLVPGDQQRFYESNDFDLDGRRILYTANSDFLQFAQGIDQFWYDLETGELSNLTQTPGQWDEHGHLSPAGSLIAWSSSRDVMDTVRFLELRTDLWVMNENGSVQTRLTYFNDPDSSYSMPGVAPSDFSWSPDGKRIVVYVIEDVATVKGQIMILDLDFKTASSNAGSFVGGAVAPGSITSIFGLGLGLGANLAETLPLPTRLGLTEAFLRDSSGTEHRLALFFSGRSQLNAYIPDQARTGNATLRVIVNGVEVSAETLSIVNTAPGVFTANADGSGAPAGFATIVNGDDVRIVQLFECPGDVGSCSPRGLDLQPGQTVVLSLFATGLRNAQDVSVRIGSQPAQVTFVGDQGQFVGLDQINIEVPSNLIGSGRQQVTITADGMTANVVTVTL